MDPFIAKQQIHLSLPFKIHLGVVKGGNGFKYAIVDPFKFVENEFKTALSIKGIKITKSSELSNEDFCDAKS